MSKHLITKRSVVQVLTVLILLYLFICVALYFFQEKMIFFPNKLEKSYQFPFQQAFEEIDVATGNNQTLHGLLFKAKNPRGLIFYLHGNAGALDSWGDEAACYTALDYDVFMLDYPGYGKSGGKIESEAQLFDAVQLVYNEIRRNYSEDKIVILGYSIGTGPAARLASVNKPRLLILQAPYYNLSDMMRRRYPIIPTFILKYKFATNEYLKSCKMPVVIFHGNEDEVIYYGSSLKLEKEFKRGDTLITLEGQKHSNISGNPDYVLKLKGFLHR